MIPISEGQEKRERLAQACERAANLALPAKRAALLAAAAELRKMAWQPINSAPKDGTFILVCQRHYRPFLARWVKVPFGGYFMGEGDADGVNPSHWMPLPAPPASEGTPEGQSDETEPRP